MRPLNEVLEAIKKIIPENFKNKEALCNSLDSITGSSTYAAPEVMYLWWGQASETLQYYLGTPNNAWKKKIVNIFGDKINYKEI